MEFPKENKKAILWFVIIVALLGIGITYLAINVFGANNDPYAGMPVSHYQNVYIDVDGDGDADFVPQLDVIINDGANFQASPLP